MIRRMYVDNFMCLSNFEFRPAALQLMLGQNGTGKSTVLKALETVRDFVVWGNPSEQTFWPYQLTRWDTRCEQKFELEIEGNGGVYSYSLLIEHKKDQHKNRVASEELRFDNGPLYEFDGHDAHLYGDDHSAGPVFPLDWSRSGLSAIPERNDNLKLAWFRRRLGRVFVFALNPVNMEIQSEKEQLPWRDLVNLVSWYRSQLQESPEKQAELFAVFADIMPGFRTLRLSRAGETTRVMHVVFSNEQNKPPSEYPLLLSELSEGQRCLIALYTILHFLSGPDTTVCIDEPDNFVSLRELQPWLNHLRDSLEEQGGQRLVISHHPELIDHLAVEHGIRFFRESGGPVRVEPFKWSRGDDLRASEIVARGWDE